MCTCNHNQSEDGFFRGEGQLIFAGSRLLHHVSQHAAPRQHNSACDACRSHTQVYFCGGSLDDLGLRNIG